MNDTVIAADASGGPVGLDTVACQHNHIHHQTTITAQINTNSRQNRNLPKGPSPSIPNIN